MVPDLVQHTLLSARNFSDTDYISIYNGNEVSIYDERTAKIRISEAEVLKGWWCPVKKLWRIPLKDSIANPNTDTLLLNSWDVQKSRNPLYSVPTSKTTVHHVQTLMTKHTPEAIKSMYEIPSIEPTIRYLHTAAGFPTKATWLKSIRRENYLTWPLINIKNVTKISPDFGETQKRHMRGQRHGLHSTRTFEPSKTCKH